MIAMHITMKIPASGLLAMVLMMTGASLALGYGTDEHVDRTPCHLSGSSAGCNNRWCMNLVCEHDQYCCDQSWDRLCVDSATVMCSGCGSSTAPCLHSHGGSGCGEQDCCQLVCTIDPRCCMDTWDSLCAAEATVLCTEQCPEDFTGNGIIDEHDLAWGGIVLGLPGSRHDIDGNGIWNSLDLQMIYDRFGSCDDFSGGT